MGYEKSRDFWRVFYLVRGFMETLQECNTKPESRAREACNPPPLDVSAYKYVSYPF
jgi:hypothetical protein